MPLTCALQGIGFACDIWLIQTSVDTATVTQFQCKFWPGDGLPSASGPMLELISLVLKSQMSSGNKPITVVCR